MTKTGIEWSEEVWNPTTGCRKISPGCDNCYAARQAHRGMCERHRDLTVAKDGRIDWIGNIRLHEDLLVKPLRWKKPRRVFVDSMSDVFNPNVPDDFIRRMFDIMNSADAHLFQILTKYSKRMLKLAPQLTWSPNIMMGVSVELDRYLFRVDDLRATGAALKFLSLEPLLGPLPNLDLTRIDWTIVGSESGQKARPMAEQWVIDICDKCLAAGVPFFFKQWGHYRNNPNPADPTAKQNGGNCKGGRQLHGREWSEKPGIGDGDVRKNKN